MIFSNSFEALSKFLDQSSRSLDATSMVQLSLLDSESSTLDMYLTGIAFKDISSKTSLQLASNPETILTRLGIPLEIAQLLTPFLF